MKDESTYLVVFPTKSILHEGKETYEFLEGTVSSPASRRLKNIKEKFKEGFLPNLIEECRKKPDVLLDKGISDDHLDLLNGLLNYTSEKGRALVGLTVLQLCIKAIEPDQSIRLHKSSRTKTGFSWVEGMPMRVLDKNFITPVLRKYGLLSLNADGFMMTRSLAENYPYSKVYKAAIRGSREEWLEIVDLLESKQLDASNALYHLITLLINKSEDFKKLSDDTMKKLDTYLSANPDIDEVTKFIKNFVDSSSYSARIFELALHSLFQVFEELKELPGSLKPLTQMRSANKKHGNIGDIEVVNNLKNTTAIFEAWDAKYGKPYLRDELEEISEKLAFQPEAEVVGFVVNESPNLKDEITERLEEIKEEYETEIKILSFEEWVNFNLERVKTEGYDSKIFANKWLRAFTESLCQKRRELAPLDEPCDEWVAELNNLL